MRRPIYFDYNATCPLDPLVREAMLPFLNEGWGNPSSIHSLGRQARSRLDEFRETVAGVLHCKPSEVVFTSGGTESNNLALIGTARLLKHKGNHIVTASVEHHAVLNTCRFLEAEGFEVTYLPVDKTGRVSPESLRAALRKETILVSIMAANNEIGTLQPVAELGRLCRENGVLFHTDAVQWFGKQPFSHIEQFEADLVSICAHKIYGPKGVGALYIRSPLLPKPILFGGSHENERRAGTENLLGIAGLVEAMKRFIQVPVFQENHLLPLTERLIAGLKAIDGVKCVTPEHGRLANTVSFVTRGTDSIALLANLDLEDVCASSGSACSAGSLEPSHVVKALGISSELQNSFVRFSLGRETTLDEVILVEQMLPEVISRSRGS